MMNYVNIKYYYYQAFGESWDRKCKTQKNVKHKGIVRLKQRSQRP